MARTSPFRCLIVVIDYAVEDECTHFTFLSRNLFSDFYSHTEDSFQWIESEFYVTENGSWKYEKAVKLYPNIQLSTWFMENWIGIDLAKKVKRDLTCWCLARVFVKDRYLFGWEMHLMIVKNKLKKTPTNKNYNSIFHTRSFSLRRKKMKIKTKTKTKTYLP